MPMMLQEVLLQPDHRCFLLCCGQSRSNFHSGRKAVPWTLGAFWMSTYKRCMPRPTQQSIRTTTQKLRYSVRESRDTLRNEISLRNHATTHCCFQGRV